MVARLGLVALHSKPSITYLLDTAPQAVRMRVPGLVVFVGGAPRSVPAALGDIRSK